LDAVPVLTGGDIFLVICGCSLELEFETEFETRRSLRNDAASFRIKGLDDSDLAVATDSESLALALTLTLDVVELFIFC